MDATLCRDHLKRLLAEEADALLSLEALLEKEHLLITSNDIEALESTGSEREDCINNLLRIDAERLSLCRNTGRSADKAGLLSLIQWCDHQGILQQRWKDNTSSIRHTRALNDRNGALVTNRLKRVEVMLDTLNTTQSRDSRVYTARGNAYQQTQSGRVCNIQA
ncbi:MAG: flagellar protein FlgN [Steroidobacteraceae bacterium]